MKKALIILALALPFSAIADEPGPFICFGKSSADPTFEGTARASSLQGIEAAVRSIFNGFVLDELKDENGHGPNSCLIEQIIGQQTGKNRQPIVSHIEIEVSNQVILPMSQVAFWITKPAKRKNYTKTTTSTPLSFRSVEKRFEIWSEKIELPYAACYYRCDEDKSKSVAKEGK